MKVPSFNAVKKQEAKRRLAVIGRRGLRSATVWQRRVSLAGGGAKWRITNLRQVADAMAKWA